MSENKTYSKTILLFFSFLIVFFKISISYILYPGEENFIKIVMDINSMQFISLIKSYSNFNFNPTFGLETMNDFKNLAFPFMSTFFHSTLLSLIGLNSFYVIEFIGIFIFLFVFYKILKLLNFSKNNSVIITLFIFTIPNIAPEINFIFSKEFEMIVYNLKNLYNTRMPRPLVSNLYFYLYIFMIIKIYIKKSFSIKNSIYLALLSSISLHTFFYFSFIENFFLLVTVFAFYKKKTIYHILDNKKFYIVYLITNLISLFCLIIILKFISIDNYKIVGLHEINLDQKIILIKTFFNYLSNKYFIINFLICSIFFIFIRKYEKNLQIFYYLYLGSILSFFTFILLYNKNVHYYYFQTFVIISSFIFISLCILKFLENKFSIFKNTSFSFVGFVFLISLVLNNSINYINFKSGNEILHSSREDFGKLVKFINNDKFLNNKKTQILTLDSNIFTILQLKDFNNFTIIPNSFWTVRPISTIEQNLYKSFKNLGYDDNSFINVFKNDELDYRITGKITNDYFGLIYLANKNIRYSQYEDYLENEIKIIKSTSPFRTQQFIVPQSEYKRLKKNYNKFRQNSNDIGLIIIDKNDEITKKYNIDENKYCKIYTNESYVVYKNKLYCE